MKKVIHIALLIVGLATMVTFSSCGVWKLDSKVKKLELGMTKKEVVNILGNNYTALGAVVTPDGNLETIRYQGSELDRDYVVRFLDGKLVEWFMDIPGSHPVGVPVVPLSD